MNSMDERLGSFLLVGVCFDEARLNIAVGT
jgi:hypothetical protein